MAETFELNDAEMAHADEWIEQHRKDEVIEYTGAIGGRFAFVFIPTSINVVKAVRCTVCGASENLNEVCLALDPYARGNFSPGFRLKPGDAGRFRRARAAAMSRKELYNGDGFTHLSTEDLRRYQELLYDESVALQSTDEPCIMEFCEKRIRENTAEGNEIKAVLTKRGMPR